MIHVERITYYNGTDCNQAVTDLQVCGQPLTGSDTGLAPVCNGKVTCNEVSYYSYCPGSKSAKVDYRCIPGNDVYDMCAESIIQNTNIIFISTPNYPLTPSFTDISPCRCSIRGSSITSIQILELALTSDDGTNSSLEIKYGGVTYKTESFSDTIRRRVYNKRLSTTSTTAEISFNHAGSNRQYLWIEVQGVSMLAVCTTAPVLTSTKLPPTTTTKTSTVPPTPSSSSSLPSTSSSSPPSSPSTSSSSSSTFSSISSSSSSFTSFPVSSSSPPSSSSSSKPPSPTESFTSKQNQDSDKDRQTIIAVSVVLSLCLLLDCITVIVVCILFRKGKIVWVKKPPQVERERSPYSGLDLNQRVAGNDGTYQELNTRNSTPQYNNVSQNTHNDYYNLN